VIHEKAPPYHFLFHRCSNITRPIPVAAWCRAWVCGRSPAGISGSHPVHTYSPRHVSINAFRFQPFLTLRNNVNCLPTVKQLSYCPSELPRFFLSSYLLIFDVNLTCFTLNLPCIPVGLSRELRCLRRGCTAAFFQGLRVRIPPGACMSISCECRVCCHVSSSAYSRSLVQRSPIECGVSEYDSKASIIRRPSTSRVCFTTKKKVIIHGELV
jgi:hypothetical protein